MTLSPTTSMNANHATRALSPLERLLDDAQNALETVAGAPRAARPNPGAEEADVVLDDAERRHAAGLMRINHVGEVCAQALYVGQAAVARDPQTRAQLQGPGQRRIRRPTHGITFGHHPPPIAWWKTQTRQRMGLSLAAVTLPKARRPKQGFMP